MRPRREGAIGVRNISKDAVKSEPVTLPLISISDRYSKHLEIPGEKKGRHVLRLDFFPGDYFDDKEKCVKEEHAAAITKFMAELPEGTTEILVNCGEGKIRSYTVCEAMYHRFDQIDHHSGRGQMDRYTFHGLMDAWEKQDATADVLAEDQ